MVAHSKNGIHRRYTHIWGREPPPALGTAMSYLDAVNPPSRSGRPSAYIQAIVNTLLRALDAGTASVSIESCDREQCGARYGLEAPVWTARTTQDPRPGAQLVRRTLRAIGPRRELGSERGLSYTQIRRRERRRPSARVWNAIRLAEVVTRSRVTEQVGPR